MSYGALQTTVTDARGNATTYNYNRIWGAFYVTKVTGPCASCGGGGQTQEWTYDNRGRVTRYMDGEGKTTTYRYYDNGDLLEMDDALDGQTTYTYDAVGRLASRRRPNGALVSYAYVPAGPQTITESVTSNLNRQTSFSYDGQNRLEFITDPEGKQTKIDYHPAGDIWHVIRPWNATTPTANRTTLTYNAMGRLETLADPLNNTTGWEYDAPGRIKTITFADAGQMKFTYDLGGRRTRAEDQLTRPTQYVYDPYGRLERVIDALGGTTRFEYDATSNLVTITDARDKATLFEYDEYNRAKRVTYPDTRYESFTYDDAGRLRTRIDRKNVVKTYSYDALSRLSGISYSDGTAPVAYTYDSVGNMLTATNATDNLSWTYDLAGRMLTEGSSATASVLSYTYDSNNNRLTLDANGSQYFAYQYDDASRLTRIRRGLSVFQLEYDEVGRRTSLQYPFGRAAATYAYDAVSRVTNIDASGPQWANGHHITYAHNAAGEQVHMTATDGVSYDNQYDYIYDLVSRLIEFRQVGYGDLAAYTYDGVGNLNSGQLPWTYDDSNRLLVVPIYPGTTYGYDDNGNRSSKRVDGNSPWIYEWDAEDRLTRVVKDEQEVARYAYDALGRRKAKTVGSATTQYIYDGTTIFRTMVGGEIAQTYTHGPRVDEPLLLEDGSGQRRYLLADALGSIITGLSATGSLKMFRDYRPLGNFSEWGEIFLGGEHPDIPYAYTGREWDAETRLYYYRARYYDPDIGRFLSEDPIRFWGGVNFYAYVGNNPVKWTDPLGLLVELYCVPVGQGSENPLHVAAGIGGLKHCFIRTKCDCPSRPGQPPYDYRLEVTREDDGRAVIPDPQGFSPGGGTQAGIEPPDNDSAVCEHEDCLLKMYRLIQHQGRPYSSTGPNSNTFVRDLLALCGMRPVWPWIVVR